MRSGRALFLGAIGVSVLSFSASSSGAHSAAVAPTFGSPRDVVTLPADDVGSATGLETGDLNGDGIADVVVTRITYPPAFISHPIGIFLADGHGGFSDGSSMWDGPPARTEWGNQIVIADFNGDHRNDIFVADTGYDASPFPGHANALALSTPQGKLVDASRNLPPESGFSHSATAADVNGDGSIDIFVGNLCCGDHTPPEILLNDGTGHFTRRLDLLPADIQQVETVGRYTRSLFVDVNGDHAPDLVLGADDHTPNSVVLINDGTGHFHYGPALLPPKPFGPNAIVISLATLDVNGDGLPDLLAGFTRGDPRYLGRFIQVLINNGNGTFRDETAQRMPSQDGGQSWPAAIRLADFNGDGHLDFVVEVNAANGANTERVPLYLDDGTGIYHPVPFAAAAPLSGTVESFGIVDANGDGHPDVFSTFAANGGIPERHTVELQVVRPSAPTGLRARSRPASISLTWRAVAGANAYEVWRSMGAAARRPIATTVAPRYDDKHARPEVTYTYVVRAKNEAGTGPFSPTVRSNRR
jgi:hypothetical protein